MRVSAAALYIYAREVCVRREREREIRVWRERELFFELGVCESFARGRYIYIFARARASVLWLRCGLTDLCISRTGGAEVFCDVGVAG